MTRDEREAMEARLRLGDGNVCFQCLEVFDWDAMVKAETACIDRCHAVVETVRPHRSAFSQHGRCRTEGRLCPACTASDAATLCFEHADAGQLTGIDEGGNP